MRVLYFFVAALVVAGQAYAQTQQDAMQAKAAADAAYVNAIDEHDANTTPAALAAGDALTLANMTRVNCKDAQLLAEGDAERAAGNTDAADADTWDAAGLVDLNKYLTDHAAAQAAAINQQWAVAVDKWNEAAEHANDARVVWQDSTAKYWEAEAHYLTAEALYALGAPAP